MNINLINCIAGIVQFWLYYYSLPHCLLLLAFSIFIGGFDVLCGEVLFHLLVSFNFIYNNSIAQIIVLGRRAFKIDQLSLKCQLVDPGPGSVAV